jgi:hypothetical protein
MCSNHANLRITFKISFRSSQLVLKKPGPELGLPQATNFISACQKHFSSSIENAGARQTKKIIGRVAADVKAPVSEHNQEAGPALPESPNSKNNKDNVSQA